VLKLCVFFLRENNSCVKYSVFVVDVMTVVLVTVAIINIILLLVSDTICTPLLLSYFPNFEKIKISV
jgi:hypothetical protein